MLGVSSNETLRSQGIAYCWLFSISVIACSLVTYLYGNGWEPQRPVAMAANVSSASVGIALFVICLWEGTKMVLANLSRDKWRKERDAEWDAWLKRRDEAQKNGQPFDEPSPSQRDQSQDRR